MTVDASYFGQFIDEAIEILSEWEKNCFILELGTQTDALDALYRGAHNLKSGSAAVGLAEFSAFIHKVEDLLSSVLAGKVTNSPPLIRLLLDIHTFMVTWLGAAREDATAKPGEAKLRLENEVLALASGGAGEVAEQSSQHSIEAHAPETESPKSKPANLARQVESVRVPANKLDMLIQLVGDISTQQSIVWHGWLNNSLHTKSCDNAIRLIQKNCKELQGVALSLRMQPLEPLFQRLERAARDLARSQGKKIDVRASGDHVELDKVVIERITEALMHVIRNAVDHGIENGEERLGHGKNEAATVRLEGSQEPGGICIKISDDGRGLNIEKILKKAIEKGLARADQKYTDSEIQRFIFLPGFSTADKISDVSGRGVGMDVVKNAVQSIGGSINIASTPGQGTTFSVSLPTTLSIVDSLIIKVSGKYYAIPLQDVAEIIDLSGFSLNTAGSHGKMLQLRHSVVPVESLKEHLPLTHFSEGHSAVQAGDKRTDSIQPALIVRAGGETVAFQIDHIIGQQSVSIRPLPGGLDLIAGYTGASILGDGDPCIILNLPALASLHLERVGRDMREEFLAESKGSEQENEARETVRNMDREAASKHLVFCVQEKMLATPLLSVREILSDSPYSQGIESSEHVLGRIDVRGQILPVIDLARSMKLRKEKSNGPLIVVDNGKSAVAIIVDRIESVADLTVTEAEGSSAVARYRGEIISTIDLNAFSKSISSLPEVA